MTSTADNYIQKMIASNPLMEPLYKQAIHALELQPGTQGLDVGCGIGLQCLLLADAVGPAGHVTGLDVTPEFLTHAETIIKRAGFMDRVSFKIGDMNALPFEDDTFDWVWSANCVGYPAREPFPLLKELARVVRPGGKIAILIYASQMLLPGYPMLEARLNATSTGIAPFTSGMKPETHHMRVLGWFRQAGFENAVVKSFVGDACAPLCETKRKALASLIDMRWGAAESEMSAEDWALFLRITHPNSPEYILNFDDYYAFVTVSLFQGRIRE
jgi:ubiquinone/menaquinone biosynthesis C-methylase UbiE